MGEMSSEGASLGAGLDLKQFYQVFFEEAGENLDRMEQLLLESDLATADDETLNSIFRCAHSVKGGAATFGFMDVSELTHQMETLLDKLRRHELAPNAAMVDVLLLAVDALRAQLARHSDGGQGEAVDTAELLARIRALSGAPATAAAKPAAAKAAAPAAKPAKPAKPAKAAKPARKSKKKAAADEAAAAPAGGAKRTLELTVAPQVSAAAVDGVVELFGEIVDLGTIEPLPGADGARRFKVVTASSESELLDLFAFHVSRDQVTLAPLDDAAAADAPAAAAEAPVAAAPAAAPATQAAAPADNAFGMFGADAAAADAARHAQADAASRAAASKATADATTLRVSVKKVDQLINLVGELVITQAMLAQTSVKVDPVLNRQLASGLADLDRTTRDLQQSVMSIRMIPMSVVFSRFPRMLRDLATKLGKKVEFVTQGEATELDKGLVEKITDPLTHLVRNSCDHGIEMPAERLAKGKPEAGTITLAASHQGGSIVIEVRDDGRGLNRAKLIQKARERGMDVSDSMSDSEAWALIFAPGLSTAEEVTDVSGRGVGMDVVRKNITALGGTVEIESAPDRGTSVRVRLPLTLAIMDSMSIAVGGETYILPLASVVESFQVGAEQIRTIGGTGRVVQVRGEYLPVIDLGHVFDVRRLSADSETTLVIVVEADGYRAALMVDELLGQHPVVVKNLESNYHRITDVAAATIMGDGRVALILDVASLVRRARH